VNEVAQSLLVGQVPEAAKEAAKLSIAVMSDEKLDSPSILATSPAIRLPSAFVMSPVPERSAEPPRPPARFELSIEPEPCVMTYDAIPPGLIGITHEYPGAYPFGVAFFGSNVADPEFMNPTAYLPRDDPEFPQFDLLSDTVEPPKYLPGDFKRTEYDPRSISHSQPYPKSR
jgi:hypothetical protein